MIMDIGSLEKIASGATADVFVLDETKVIKVFYEKIDNTLIENEFKVNKLVQSYGIRAPNAYELVNYGNQKGVVFQRLNNFTLKEEISKNLINYAEYASFLAREHIKINDVSDHLFGLSDQKKSYVKYINSRTSIDENCKNKLIERLNSFPENDKVCHGDFHPGNILYDDNEAFVIDWLGATRGNPFADAAGSYLIMKITGAGLFADAYIKEYISISNAHMCEIDKWIPIRAATYLDFGLPNEINNELKKLIYDSTK